MTVGLLSFATPPQFSQRSVINLGFMNDNSYPFINFYLAGDGSTGPTFNQFTTSALPWPAYIDANGWPNTSLSGVTGNVFGGAVRIPGSDEYTGKWVITWSGDGRVVIQGGTWTVDAASSSNYVQNGNGDYTNTAGAVPRIVVTLSAATGPQLFVIPFTSTDPNSTGAFAKNFKFYQLGDETDLNAGKVFRANYKQQLVNLNPSAIRFLNWDSGSSARICRFETRTLPSNAGYSYFTNWVASPIYADATGTNQFSASPGTPTAANPKTVPVSLTHGEVAIVRMAAGSGTARSLGQYGISAISNATSNPQVTTFSAHGLATNDIVVHFNISGGTFTNLNYFPCKVTVVDATHYTIQSQGGVAINTSGYGTFTGGTGTQYWSINVGGRGAKPIVWGDASSPASIFGFAISAGNYVPLVYDKNIAILGDGAGNLSTGAWVFDNSGQGWRGEVPLEIMTALINEVNALSSKPVHMWVNMPATGLTSMDPDYTTGSDYALNAVGVILNGANGFAGLTANAKLFVEYANETWNSSGGFLATFYLARMGFLRWPASGQTDYVDMYTLRSTIVMRALAAQYGLSRIKRVLSGQGFVGFSVGSLNEARVNASSTAGQQGNFYLTDALASGFGAPITNHDCFATATYFDNESAYYTGQFITDSALYAGGGAGQTTAITNFVNNVVSGSGQSVNGYLNNSLSGLTATYATAMKALGKTAIDYEGGPNWNTAVGGVIPDGGSHTITAADSTFLIAILNSTQWRDTQINYFNRTSQVAGSAMPSVYTYIGSGVGNQRWSYCSPDSFVGATEGQALLNSPVWSGMSARNQALSP